MLNVDVEINIDIDIDIDIVVVIILRVWLYSRTSPFLARSFHGHLIEDSL
jgi:hypothetical protein